MLSIFQLDALARFMGLCSRSRANSFGLTVLESEDFDEVSIGGGDELALVGFTQSRSGRSGSTTKSMKSLCPALSSGNLVLVIWRNSSYSSAATLRPTDTRSI